MEKITKIIETIRLVLRSHGGDIRLVFVDDKNIKIRLLGSCRGCPGLEYTTWGIEALFKANHIAQKLIISKSRKPIYKFLKFSSVDPFTTLHPALWHCTGGIDFAHGLSKIHIKYFSHCRVTEICVKYCDEKKAIENIDPASTYNYQVHSYCKKCGKKRKEKKESWCNRGGKPGEVITHFNRGFSQDSYSRGRGYRTGL